VAKEMGDRLARLCGVDEPLEVRLRRVHSSADPRDFRVRQLLASLAALVLGTGLATVAPVPVAAKLLFSAGPPLLVFLVVEQNLARRSESWQASLAAELPVVAEQLSMLVNSGYSLGSALSRLVDRGSGCVAADLARVVNRVGQGVGQADALREWADLARVDSVSRLVSLLVLHSSAADLGRLLTAEARQARRDIQRRTVEQLEKRAQQVWVPVTVATLVPGSILLAVPFLAALRLFSNA
jgi:Flp pilus assembly protein TadB